MDIGSAQGRFQDPLVAGHAWSVLRRALALAATLATGSLATAQEAAPASAPACSMSAADRAWIERALEAWRFTSREITGIGGVPNSQAVFFDAGCVLTSADALTNPSAQGVTWSATPHGGSIPVPDGSERPVGITSFASGKDGLRFFVMSTPSVWLASGVGEGGLETTMVAVLLHECSHVAQIGPYGKRLDKLIEENSLPDSFNDNALQERFGSNAEFTASVKKETGLFLKAAAERDDVEARFLAFEARELMRERQARWLVGDDAYLAEAEDIFLTFEGSGQWAAYQWMVHAKGGAQDPADVIPRYARDGEWSQAAGFGVVMALDRIVGPAWKKHAFGDGARTVLEMLDDALAE
jgi:hypothetical protein